MMNDSGEDSLLKQWYGSSRTEGEPPRKFVGRREFFCPTCGAFSLHAVAVYEGNLESKCLTCGDSEVFVSAELGIIQRDTTAEEILVMMFGTATLSKRIQEVLTADGSH